jgi:hypothetical protein
MSVATLWPPAPLRRPLATVRDRQPLWWRVALGFAALAVAFLLFVNFDVRTLNGVSVWIKPFKFALSLAVYFTTLAWFAPLLPPGHLATRSGRWLARLPVYCAVLEIVYIALQAGRGEPSHFNVATPLYSALYSLMGAGAVVLVTVCLWLGVTILRRHGMRDPYAFAVGIGLVLTFVLGGGFGGYLGSHMSHWVGGTSSDANGTWLFNWSRDGGDLRVAHFFGMHAMQLLPLLAGLLPRRLPRLPGIGLVGLAAVAYTIFTIWVFIEALRGEPFIAA